MQEPTVATLRNLKVQARAVRQLAANVLYSCGASLPDPSARQIIDIEIGAAHLAEDVSDAGLDESRVGEAVTTLVTEATELSLTQGGEGRLKRQSRRVVSAADSVIEALG